MYVILFMTALPMIAVIVPVYKMFLNIGLLDSIPGVILYMAASGLPYGIWLMKNFMDGVPGRTGRSRMGRWSNYHAVHLKGCCTTDVPWNLCSIYLYILRKLG